MIEGWDAVFIGDGIERIWRDGRKMSVNVLSCLIGVTGLNIVYHAATGNC